MSAEIIDFAERRAKRDREKAMMVWAQMMAHGVAKVPSIDYYAEDPSGYQLLPVNAPVTLSMDMLPYPAAPWPSADDLRNTPLGALPCDCEPKD